MHATIHSVERIRRIPASSQIERLLSRLPQLGLVAHLGLAFLAVAALAIAANIIAEHGTLIIRTTDVVPVPVETPISVNAPDGRRTARPARTSNPSALEAG